VLAATAIKRSYETVTYNVSNLLIEHRCLFRVKIELKLVSMILSLISVSCVADTALQDAISYDAPGTDMQQVAVDAPRGAYSAPDH